MGYKVQGTINKSKKYYIIYGILWLFSVIVLVMPISAGITEAIINGKFDFGLFFEKTYGYISKPFSSFYKVFGTEYLGIFLKTLGWFTLGYLVFAIIGILRNAPKSEYEDIEHGSSDWSKNGEQYKILSNKKGIILGQDNYLPVDKRGNVNVLVVGRFWFW